MSADVSDIRSDQVDILVDTIVEDMRKDLPDFVRHAQTAAWEAKGKMNASFTMTVSVKKQDRNDEVTLHLEVNSRERMPKPVIKRELDFDATQQLVLI